MWIYYNPNPEARAVGDCTIRALTKAFGEEWDAAYSRTSLEGFLMKDMPSSNSVWGAVLLNNGFTREAIPDTCPMCYTIRDFCADHQSGMFVVGTGSHVVTIVDGDYYDSWDSGNEIPIFYYYKKEI